MKNKKKTQTKTTNSSMVTRPIAKCFPIFLLPITIAFMIGFVYPFLKGLYLSFCSFTTTSDAQFIGVSNYLKALKDATFVHAFGLCENRAGTV